MKKKKILINYTSLDIVKTKKNKIKTEINRKNQLNFDKIKKNFVIIKVEYSNLNYKDFLISKNHNNLIKNFPHTAGIDACGTICFSNSKKFKVKDKVFVLAQPLGVEKKGSFAEYITIPDFWVEKLPKFLNPKEIMSIGTSGFTAVKAFNKSLNTILKYRNKPVLVTGASSNVGMLIIILLINIGINVEAVTSKKANSSILRKLGVKKIHFLKDLIKTHNFSLLNEKYSAVFDNLGGAIVSTSLKYLIKKGVFISIGNILGNISNINLLPLILREVSVLGINAESSKSNERKKIYQSFKSSFLKKNLISRTKVLNLKDVSKIMNSNNFDKKALRYVIKI